MRVWQIPSFGIDSLEFVERPNPEPGPGEVLVKSACSFVQLSRSADGEGPLQPQTASLPRIPCSDGAGEVVAVGEGVTAVEARRPRGRHLHAELAGRPADAGQRRKARWAATSTACSPSSVVLNENGLVRSRTPELRGSGHAALRRRHRLECAGGRRLKPGGTVLIQGTGGVSIFALQFARLMGARVLGISGSDEKLERATALGLMPA